MEEHGSLVASAANPQVREILRVNLGIARDVPILRVKRAHTGIVHAVESARK